VLPSVRKHLEATLPAPVQAPAAAALS
jgi:hypothetical protein